ncbi:hypothetical protein QVD17_03595 [Tagetes erecta]|uniref:Uncharacterized protein n=1 Tax=Tagetes erecta TaxID=13708 RepID=A0AAD8LA93_TARER|nr:hypothetical protein QVD17_03595 [Tagetes erecta]
MATILNYNTTHLVSTPARVSSLRFTGSSRSQNKHKSFPVLVLAGNNSIPDISFKEFNTQLTNWANKQCLLVGTVGIAAYFASQSFFPAFILKTLYEFLSPLEASEIQQLGWWVWGAGTHAGSPYPRGNTAAAPAGSGAGRRSRAWVPVEIF